MGHDYIETSNIDRLAAEGMTFTRGYSVVPVCRPSLASIATGLYPHQHMVIGNDPLFEFDKGKRWSVEWLALRNELNESISAEFEKLLTLARILGEQGYVSLQTGKWWEGHYSVGGFTEGMTLGHRHGDKGLTIGRERLAENTLFVYVTDNGWIQNPEQPKKGGPRAKLTPYEMGIRTPIIFRWKDSIITLMDDEHLVNSIDIASTILHTCGSFPTENMQGINVLDPQMLTGREHIFAESYDHDFTTVDSSLRYRIILELPWKLILPHKKNLPGDQVELFNVVDDPHEFTNLAGAHPEIVAGLIYIAMGLVDATGQMVSLSYLILVALINNRK